MRLKKSMSMLIAISMLVSNVPIVMAKEEAVKIPSRSIYTHKEIIGKDRYETGRKVLEESKRYKNIIVVNGSEEKLVDGLCASGLVEKLNATILPINPKKVDKKSMEYINKAENVYIIGEKQAIPYSFEKSINKKVKVVRIGGKDRYETSEKIAKYIGSYDKAYLVNGAIGHPDAMSISSVAAKEKSPIILTKKDSSKVDKKKGVEYTAIGGTSVISNSLVSKYSAKRIGGETRYETNRMVLNEYYPNSSIRYFTNGETLVDALSAASISKNNGITFINRHKNHDLLEYIDTVQVGGFPYDVIFVNNGTGTGGSGGTVVPPSKPENIPPTSPTAKAIVEYEKFDTNKKEYPVKIQITTPSTDPDGDSAKITYEYRYKDNKGNYVIKKLEEKEGYYPIGNYPVGSYKVEVRAVDSSGKKSGWSKEVTINVNPPVVEKAVLKTGSDFKSVIKGMKDFDTVTKVKFINEKKDKYPQESINLDLNNKGLVKGYITEEENGKEKVLIISADGVIYANENCEDMFSGLTNIKEVEFINFNTKDVTSMVEMFKDCANLERVDLSKCSSTNAINMNNMFYGCANLSDIQLATDKDTGTLKSNNMYAMFAHCGKESEKEFNLDLSKVDVSEVTSMQYMFNESGLKEVTIVGNLDKSTSMANMFNECGNLEKVDLSKCSSTNAIDMNNMFYKCVKLSDIQLATDKDTGNLKSNNMYAMFAHCGKESEKEFNLDLSKVDVSEVTSMRYMFIKSGLTTLNLSNIDASKVINMTNMFEECSSLNQLIPEEPKNFGRNGCIKDSMFKGCNQLSQNIKDAYTKAN